MITSVLQTDGFYFSCTYDLTHTVQRLSSTSPEFQQMPFFERVSLKPNKEREEKERDAR